MTTARPAAPGSRGLVQPAILGGFDGTASLLGVILYLLLTHPALIFPAAASGAVSAAVSMGGGEWLSGSGNGLPAAGVMAAATFTGAVLPAVPFAFGTGPAVIAASAALCAAICVTVAFLQPGRGRGPALAETFGLLLAVAAVVLLCSLVLPGGPALWSPPAGTCGASTPACIRIR